MFLAGTLLLRHAAPGGLRVLGAALVGGVTGAFVGAMLPAAGKSAGAAVCAVLLAGLAMRAPRDGADRAGPRWRIASLALLALAFAGVATFFGVVVNSHVTGGFPFAVLVVVLPCALLGAIAGLLFTRQTAARPRLTAGAALVVVLAALIHIGLYQAPVRTLHFPPDTEVGTVRFSCWFDYGGRAAKGMVRAPLWGPLFLQVYPAAAEDLSFLRSMPTLRELDLTGIALDEAQLSNLANLKNLKMLSLTGTPISDDALVHLRTLSALTRLELEQTPIDGSGFTALENLDALEVLGLANTKVNDASLAHLKALASLRELSLYMTPVTDAGLNHLKAITTLEKVELYATGVTAAGADSLRAALPKAKVLH